MHDSIVRRLVVFSAVLACVFAGPDQAAAQANMPPAKIETPPPPTPVSQGGIEVEADRLESEGDLLKAFGNVVIKFGKDVLEADYVQVNTKTEDVHARGNVEFDRDGQLWTGPELKYNLRTGEGDFGDFKGFSEPWYIHAEDSKRLSGEETLLKNVRLSTCEGDRQEFSIRAKQARLSKDNKLRASNVLLYLGAIPVFYLPYVSKSLDDKKTNIDVVPGYSSEMGAFLLTAYNVRLSPSVRSSTHLDLRSKRGVGFGQDFIWADPDDEQKTYRGKLTTYYTNDDEPYEDEEDRIEKGDLVDNERYRIRLSHNQDFSPQDYLVAEINYQSDPYIIEDFFDEEFRNNAQPENRVTLTHNADSFNASAEIKYEPHDFYDNLNTLPVGLLEFNRRQIGTSGFYYEGVNRAGFYERVFQDTSNSDDYDAFRLDSQHGILYPTRHFGFLNLIPRASYRGTYYSETTDETTEEVEVATTDTNGVVSVTNETVTVSSEEGADFRNIPEIGMEASFKAFKLLHNDPTIFGEGLRHVAEPFVNYTYVPTPNLEPEDLPQFDSIDRFDKVHNLRLGLRNKLQTKRQGRIGDLVDLVAYTDYNVDPEGDEEDFGNLIFDAEFRPVRWMKLDMDGRYDWYESEIPTYNTELALIGRDRSSLSAEYRFTKDSRSLLSSQVILWPEDKWSLNGYWRYEFETSELEEQLYMITRRMECLGIGVGFKEVDDEITLWAQLWILALPGSEIKLGK